jgi:chromosome segregation ATPase
MIQLEQTKNHYLLKIPQALMMRAKKIKPRQWDPRGLVWKYPRNKDTYELLINEFENDVEKVEITAPRNAQEDQSELLARQNKAIENLEKKVKSLESNLSLMEDQRDQYLSSVIQLTSKIDYLKNDSSDLEKSMNKITKQCIGDNHHLSSVIEEIDFDFMLPINHQTKVEKILKSKLQGHKHINNIVELIHACKDQDLLSVDAIHLLHGIRRQRNLFAHDAIDPKTRLMRVIFVIAAFSLVSSEL